MGQFTIELALFRMEAVAPKLSRAGFVEPVLAVDDIKRRVTREFNKRKG